MVMPEDYLRRFKDFELKIKKQKKKFEENAKKREMGMAVSYANFKKIDECFDAN
jgi:hypothetical protein